MVRVILPPRYGGVLTVRVAAIPKVTFLLALTPLPTEGLILPLALCVASALRRSQLHMLPTISGHIIQTLISRGVSVVVLTSPYSGFTSSLLQGAKIVNADYADVPGVSISAITIWKFSSLRCRLELTPPLLMGGSYHQYY
ncbi:hypothetical protein EDC04DRAFT_3144239 [Pisolithus marmoratus]|nr:hypothetical protein EDC04DRAFT_3144239 [Pisolithus marmoratus]